MQPWLHLIQQNYTFDFEILVDDANELLVQQISMEICMIEICKYLNGLSWYNGHHIQTNKKYL